MSGEHSREKMRLSVEGGKPLSNVHDQEGLPEFIEEQPNRFHEPPLPSVGMTVVARNDPGHLRCGW